MFKKIFLICIVLLTLSACTEFQDTDQGFSIKKKVDTNLYFLSVEIEQDLTNYTQIQGSFGGYVAGGYGSMGGSIWQDGKGLVRGRITSLDPVPTFAKIEDVIIIKTTDFKIMGLRTGDTVDLVCTVDYEPVCAPLSNTSSSAGQCYDLWEFDYCRMIDFEEADVIE
ncbi:MAG TPA: hypothetical protein P5311_00970 [Candidatus Dojkabacteria bacterium]|nr:hypothetical protein [Candidatus Dojkabacteria bacterium]